MSRLNRRHFLQGTALAGLALALPASLRAQNAAQPNIVFIMADDMGYADLGSYGAQGYETPVLDQLAADGMRFTQAYANAPVCSPTRVGLVTGRYQGRFRAGLDEPNGRFPKGSELPLDTPTVASLLRDAGYQTALVGKWHVSKMPEFGPTRYGYDSYFGIAAGEADYFTHASKAGPTRDQGLFQDDQPVARKGYLTDIIADEAIRLIETKGDKPLFMGVHFTAPHWPWEGPEDEALVPEIERLGTGATGSVKTYARLMVSMDQNIGRILDALDKAGMRDNTIVVFTSDNGAERFSNSWPLIGYKGELLEGGIRTPMIVRWPSHVAAGTTSSQVAISMDTMPTFLAAAGAPIPQGLDGANLLPQLTGAAETPRTLFWRMKRNNQAAVRQGNWKYLRIRDQEMLFDLSQDERERADLAAEHPEKLAELRALGKEWEAEMLPYPEDSFSLGLQGYADRYGAMPAKGKGGGAGGGAGGGGAGKPAAAN